VRILRLKKKSILLCVFLFLLLLINYAVISSQATDIRGSDIKFKPLANSHAMFGTKSNLLSATVKSSGELRPYRPIIILPEENGTEDIQLVKSSEPPYYYISARKILKAPTATFINKEEKYVMSNGLISVIPLVPSVWQRSSTIRVKVRFENHMPFPFHYSGYIKCYVKDTYYSGSSRIWVTEAFSQKYVSFTIAPYSRKTVSLYVHIGYTTVGLKKVVVEITGTLQLTFDLGYNFVQKVNTNELGTPTKVNSLENYFELSDLFHFNQWSVLKKAAKAIDAGYQDRVSIRNAAQDLMNWIYYHFIYYTSNVALLNYTASDIWLLSNTYNEYYIGVCDEYTVLYISFARGMNIPTRMIAVFFVTYFSGQIVLDGTRGSLGHIFAEIWDGNTWVHVDATNYLFDDHDYYKEHDYNIGFIYVLQGADDDLSNYDEECGPGIVALTHYGTRIPNVDMLNRNGYIDKNWWKSGDILYYFEYNGSKL